MMRAAGVLMWAVGCGSAEPDPLSRLGTALEAWDRAQASDSLQLEALSEARAADPVSIAAARALARAELDAGNVDAALATLDAVVPPQPSELHAHLLWDRAALRSRAGRIDDAAADIRRCLILGIDARALAIDPDLASVRADPDFGQLLPTVEIRARESASSSEVLLGETWQRTIELSAPPGSPRIESVGAPPASLQLLEVVEDIVTADEWTENRRIQLTYAAVAPGAAHVPAHQVQVARKSTTLGTRRVEVVAVGSMKATGGGELAFSTLPLPSAFAGTPLTPEVVARDAHSLLRWPAHVDCRLAFDDLQPVRLIARVGGQPSWKGALVAAGTEGRWECGRGGNVSASGDLP